jgi:hypothetical protein
MNSNLSVSYQSGNDDPFRRAVWSCNPSQHLEECTEQTVMNTFRLALRGGCPHVIAEERTKQTVMNTFRLALRRRCANVIAAGPCKEAGPDIVEK